MVQESGCRAVVLHSQMVPVCHAEPTIPKPGLSLLLFGQLIIGNPSCGHNSRLGEGNIGIWATSSHNLLGLPVLLIPFFFFFFFFFWSCFRAIPTAYMEVPSLGVESELWPLAYFTIIAMSGLRHVCDLHHTSQQCWILNPLNKPRD